MKPEIATEAREYAHRELTRLVADYDSREVGVMLTALISTWFLNMPVNERANYYREFRASVERFTK